MNCGHQRYERQEEYVETPEPEFIPDRDLEEMRLFDLQKCDTISDIAKGFEGTAFGARMLGEVTETLSELAHKGKPSLAVYDGDPDSPVGRILKEMVAQRMFSDIRTSDEYQPTGDENNAATFVGLWSPRNEKKIYEGGDRTIFVNPFALVRPGQTRDGYFPDVAFDDPNFALPFIQSVLNERLHGETMTATQFIDTLRNFEGVAPQIVKGAEVLKTMVEDPECRVFLTLSGAMTIAQMTLVVCDMIDSGMVQSITSTGALMAHGLIQGTGLRHYKYHPDIGDLILRRNQINRVTTVLEPETNFTHIADILGEVLGSFSPDEFLSPAVLHKRIGEYLQINYPDERGILKSACERMVPVFVPAFFDSELGNDFTANNMLRERAGMQPLVMNLDLDNRRLVEIMTGSKKLGIFTVGGGVPRNWTQNGAPLIDIIKDRLKIDLQTSQFSHAVRISPDQMHIGHLSGCTYEEGKSWGKFTSDADTSEIRSDATHVWPIIVKYVLESARIPQKKAA